MSPDRYQSLRLCVGERLVQCLAKQRLFMVMMIIFEIERDFVF